MTARNLPLLLETDALAPAIEQDKGLVLVHVSAPEPYLEAHIPGARFLHPGQLQCGVAPAPGKLPDQAQLEDLLGGLGLKPDDHVVAYDDEGGGWAGRLLWTLETVGHKHYSYLNGGIHAWAAEERALESGVAETTPTHYPVRIQRAEIAEVEDIQRHRQ